MQSSICSICPTHSPKPKLNPTSKCLTFLLVNQYFKILGTHVITHITFWEWCWGSKRSSLKDEELLGWRWLTSLRWEPAPPPPVHRGRSEPWNQGELTQPGSTPRSESLVNRSYMKIKIIIQQQQQNSYIWLGFLLCLSGQCQYRWSDYDTHVWRFLVLGARGFAWPVCVEVSAA